MTSNWQLWQGRTIAGKYILGDCAGGSDQSAVFRTNFEGQSAALKLISATPAAAERRLGLWKRAAGFTHPNLIRILDYGRHSEDGREFLYIVEEFAEETLSQIIPERALTAEEVRGMLPPVLDALASIHSKDLVHSRIHPANILAVGDQVKLSSDSLRPTGDISRAATPYDAPEATSKGLSTASDVWSLGMTLAEVLTQRLPSADAAAKSATISAAGSQIPEPLRTIISRCVEADPAARCSIGEIRERIAGRTSQVTTPVARPVPSERPTPAPAGGSDEPKSFKWQYAAAAAVLGAAALFLFRSHSSNSGNEAVSTQPSSTQTTTQSTTNAPERSPEQAKRQAKGQRKDQAPESSKPTAAATSRTSERPAPPPAEAMPSNRPERASSENDVVERTMPQVSPSARHTIHGKIKVRVQVSADAAGNITQASLKTAGPSKYFAHAALEAARQWKFAPAPGAQSNRPRSWLITFGFTRAKTEASATPAR